MFGKQRIQEQKLQNKALLNVVAPMGIGFAKNSLDLGENRGKVFGLIHYPQQRNIMKKTAPCIFCMTRILKAERLPQKSSRTTEPPPEASGAAMQRQKSAKALKAWQKCSRAAIQSYIPE